MYSVSVFRPLRKNIKTQRSSNWISTINSEKYKSPFAQLTLPEKGMWNKSKQQALLYPKGKISLGYHLSPWVIYYLGNKKNYS